MGVAGRVRSNRRTGEENEQRSGLQINDCSLGKMDEYRLVRCSGTFDSLLVCQKDEMAKETSRKVGDYCW